MENNKLRGHLKYKAMSKESVTRKFVLITLLIISCVWLFADADAIRVGVLSNMPEFVPGRTPSITHGNLYGIEDTAFITARYDLATSAFSFEPEHIEITYFTKITIVFDGYPQGNKIVVNWGDYGGGISTVFSPETNVMHQYSSQVNSYNLTIKTYRSSGSTYIEEPEHEIDYVVGIFPHDGIEEVAAVDGQAVGNLTLYKTSTTGEIKKPVLIIEGFNLHSNNTVSSIIGLNPSFYQNLLSDGYDLYILTFEDCQNSLFVNAGLVLSAFGRIKSHYSEGGDLAGFGCNPIKVIGYSMGGVLARIALASAEDENGYAHGCNMLLTVDSPHRGFVINSHVQNAVETIVDYIPSSPEILHELAEISDSPVVRQFMRNNINASSLPYDFIDGSNEYTNVFDFLNPCDAHNVDHLNQDVDYYNSANYNPQLDFKSGFPWKQNLIKNYAVAFGKHEAIGNTANHSSFANAQLKWKIFGFPGSFTIPLIDDAWYDKCPGSYFPTEFHYQKKIIPDSFGNSTLEQAIAWIIGADDLKFKLNVNYDLPVVPVISSLCITNRYFAEPSQTQYIPYSQTIAEPLQTPFNQYFIPTDASPHQVLSPQCAGWIRNKLNENPESNGIIGHITGTMRYGTQLLANQQFVLTNLNTGIVFNVTSNATGIIQINNFYINTCIYEIKHYDGLYYPQLVTVNVDMFGNSEMGIINFTIPSNVVEVDQSPTSNACHTISNAFELCRGRNISHILIRAGTYRENVLVSELGDTTQNFVLEGDGSPVIIHSAIASRALSIGLFNCPTIDEFTIRNIIFEDTDNDGGGGVSLAGNINHLTMENCTIRNCGDNHYISGAEYIPVGLQSNIPIHINNCDFYNNHGESHGSTVRSLGVICLYVNQETSPSIIENCRIHDNSAGNASAIFVTGNGRFIIRNNEIRNNFQSYYIGPLYCIECKDAKNVEISNNIMDHNWYEPDVGRAEYAIGMLKTSNCTNTSNVIVKNNTLAFHRRALYVRDVNVNAMNNLIDVWNTGLYFEPGYDQSMLRYSHNFMKTYNGTVIAENYDINLPSNLGNLYGDPQVDATFRPLWNQTVMSPCIDAGNPDTDGDGIPWNGDGVNFKNDPDDIDSDGTCLDIGAYPAVQHDYEDYAMPVSGGIKWMSFPVLNRITSGYTTNSNFFEPIIDNLILDWVEFKPGDDPIIRMQNTPYGLQNGTQSVTSLVGYKVKLKNEVTNQIKINTPGFIQAPTTTINLYKYQYETTTINENWIGYFQRTSSHPFNAFASILNYVTSIRTQYWSMARMPKTGVWIMTPGVPVINYGDMVIVTVSQDCSFTWNNSVPVDPKVREKAVEFEYTEKPDYTALYLDLASLTEIPSEIGVYIEGICKGAVKVESSITDICVYLEENEALSADNCELVLYYAPKSSPDYRKTCKPKAEDILQVAENGLNYYTMKLKSDSELNPVVPITALHQNYPNPFNPTTTIDYSLAETGQVRIEIYNVKGQKVTTLVDCAKVSGSHRVVWNGTDKYGRAVSSGIYHYRLITPDMSITKKMLLLK